MAILAHPDDELLCAGALMAQRARGDRVVLLFLTRGEATDAFGPLPAADVATRRVEMAAEAARILDVEVRFLDLPDGFLTDDPHTRRRVARHVAEVRPDGLVTWGAAWVKGMRHPDHRAAGTLAVDAVTAARIARLVEPAAPYRGACPVFSIRGRHSTLPEVIVDVAPYRERIFHLAQYYRERIGFGDRDWLEDRLRRSGLRGGVVLGESFDAWETREGTVRALLPAEEVEGRGHPTRDREIVPAPSR